jgi:hypothetical protein
MPWSEARSYLRSSAPLIAVLGIAALFLPLASAVDLQVFLRAGHALLHGRAVYPQPGSAAVYSGYSFVYPYFAAWPFVPLALLPTGVATPVFFVLCAAAVIFATRVATEGDSWSAAIVLCTAFTITGLQLGSLSPLLFAGLVLMWHLRDRPAAFGLLAAPVVASKVFLAPVLLWPLVARRYRAFGWASVSTLALLAVGFLVGPLSPRAYAHLLSALSTHEARSGFGLIGALRNLGVGAGAAQVAAFVVAGALLAGVLACYRRFRDERVLFIGAIAASLLMTPVLWSHYFVLLPAALLVLDAPRRWLLVLAIASWAIAPPHGFDLEPPVLDGLTKTVAWLAAVVALIAYGYGARRSTGRLRRPPTAAQ